MLITDPFCRTLSPAEEETAGAGLPVLTAHAAPARGGLDGSRHGWRELFKGRRRRLLEAELAHERRLRQRLEDQIVRDGSQARTTFAGMMRELESTRHEVLAVQAQRDAFAARCIDGSSLIEHLETQLGSTRAVLDNTLEVLEAAHAATHRHEERFHLERQALQQRLDDREAEIHALRERLARQAAPRAEQRAPAQALLQGRATAAAATMSMAQYFSARGGELQSAMAGLVQGGLARLCGGGDGMGSPAVDVLLPDNDSDYSATAVTVVSMSA